MGELLVAEGVLQVLINEIGEQQLALKTVRFAEIEPAGDKY